MDKLYHFIVGSGIFWVVNYFISYPIIPVIIIAVLKEVYDLKIKHSRMCIWDIVATVAGGLFMGVILYVL